MIRRPPRSTQSRSSAASDVYKRQGVGRAIIVREPGSVAGRGELIRALCESGIQVDLVSGESDTFAPAMILNHVEGMPILSLPVARKTRVSKAIKVAVDRGGAAMALVVLSPLLAGCAVAIKLGSPGPVFFRQMRVGRGRVPFYLLNRFEFGHLSEEKLSRVFGAASEEADLIEGHFEARFDVLPGGTGAWQAQSRVNAPNGVPEPAARTW